jgi:molybdenum-dependent DNA-binding transcriptional regulator ModE
MRHTTGGAGAGAGQEAGHEDEQVELERRRGGGGGASLRECARGRLQQVRAAATAAATKLAAQLQGGAQPRRWQAAAAAFHGFQDYAS